MAGTGSSVVVLVVVAAAIVGIVWGLAYWAWRAESDRSAIVGLYLALGFPALFVAAIGLAVSTTGGNPGFGVPLMLTGAGFALPMVKRFRALVARASPLDPDSAADMVGLSLVLGLIAFLLAVAVGNRAVAPPAEIGSVSAVEVIVQNVALVLVAFAAVGVGFRRTWAAAVERLGLVPPTPRVIGGGLAGAVAALALLVVSGLVIQALQPGINRDLDQTVNQMTGQLQTPLGALLIGVAAGIGEESFFRGALQPRLGIVLVSVFFALVHAPQYGLNLAILALFAVSVVFGLVRNRYGTTASIIAHALYNALQLLALIATKS